MTVSPRKLISSLAEPKRRKSPISASTASAVRMPIPRKLHSHATGSRHGSLVAIRHELVLERGQLGVERVQMGEHVLKRALRVGLVEPLAAHPGDVPLGPGPLALAEDVAVAQQLLGDAMACGSARAAQVIKAADQVAQPLLLGRWWRDKAQLAGAVEAHELLGVAAVGLDAVPGAHRHQRGRDDVAATPTRPSSRNRS